MAGEDEERAASRESRWLLGSGRSWPRLLRYLPLCLVGLLMLSEVALGTIAVVSGRPVVAQVGTYQVTIRPNLQQRVGGLRAPIFLGGQPQGVCFGSRRLNFGVVAIAAGRCRSFTSLHPGIGGGSYRRPASPTYPAPLPTAPGPTPVKQ